MPRVDGLVRHRWFVPSVAGLIGAVAMTAALGPSLVDPTNIDWLMHADYRLYVLGWHLFRHGPWTWPLGAAPLLIWPIGSSIGLTDAIPLLAFIFKPFDAVLPDTFQFIGFWLVLSFALQGVFGALLMRLATPRPSLQLLGACVLIMSPPLIFRILHPALTAHWLILAALWLCLRADADEPSRRLGVAWALLMAATALTQPYILLMIIVLMLAAHVRQVLAAPRRIVRIAASAAVSLLVAVVTLWQAGSLMVRGEDGLEVAGFGGWSANLLTFIMPTEAGSRFSPGLYKYASGGQYEGYAYLGAGTLLLATVVVLARIVSIRSLARPRHVVRHLPLVVGLLFLTAMAVGPTVTAGSRTLFTYDVAWWGPLTIFRTQGRMIWVLYYAVTVAVLLAAARFRYPVALALCLSTVTVQAADVWKMVPYIRDLHSYGFRDPLESGFWDVAPPHYQRFVLVPSNLCTLDQYVDYSAFSLLAGRHGMAINAGITARYDVLKSRAYCAELGRELRAGMRTPGSLYIVRKDLLDDLAPKKPDEGRMCTIIDGFGVCFAADTYARWSGSFDVPRSRLPSTPELMRFYNELNETYRSSLGRAARAVPTPADERVEALAYYLSYRMEGCDHGVAESKTIRHLSGDDEPGLCAVVPRFQLPPADQTYAFAVTLDETLRARAPTTAASTHVDVEGEAVWLQAYVHERARGARESDARAAVLAAIRGPAR